MRRKPKLACVIVLALPCLTAAGCVRTYDGTIVPEYTPMLAVERGVPRVEYRKSDTLPASRFVEFPSAPPPPQAEAAPSRPTRTVPRPADSGRRLLPLQVASETPVTCRTTQGDNGRVRVACN
ncbi:hypothetical protein KEU06_01795 [Pseudaminobacter sp. 19-2017]|uniref:Lipoprotein n=1 Tax=Pseudaminobacter soli (ex Zhang et al. 2022) TaxID=2831468 RepID=A0A942DVD9_9HYPH|nr:hypothetical protein [Pseudaminobacter soli]MBS3647356.1 hypothetical protein [Pseudaminobacter soli]